MVAGRPESRVPTERVAIFIINADGSGERWLGPGRAPDWSPDGARIVFAAGTLAPTESS